jgi:hypothetical protein
MSSIIRRRKGLIWPIGSLLSEGWVWITASSQTGGTVVAVSTSYRDSGFVQCVLVRSDQEAVVVNLAIEPAEPPEEVRWIDPNHPSG